MGEGEEVRTYHDVLIDFENNNNSNNKALVPKFGVGYGSSTDYFGSSRSLINFHYYYFFGNVCVGCTENQHLPKKKKRSKAAYCLPLPDLPKWELCELGISTSMFVIVNKCLCDGMVWKIGCFAWWEYQNLRKELLLI